MNKNLFDERTYINSEVAVKPYFYLRNGLLHVRYVKDCCIELSKAEEEKVKNDLTQSPQNKQNILSKAWSLYANMCERPIINDGIKEFEKRLKRNQNEYNNKDSNI